MPCLKEQTAREGLQGEMEAAEHNLYKYLPQLFPLIPTATLAPLVPWA